MDIKQDGDNIGGGNAMLGLLAGSALNRRDDDKNQWIWAVIIFIIFVVIALVFLAFMKNDRKEIPAEYCGNKNNYGELITGLIAAKSMDNGGNCKNNQIDMLEIMQKLEHNEDRAEMRRTQTEISQQGQNFLQVGFGLSGQINNTEKTSLENFARVENQLGQLTQGVGILLQEKNNEQIINGVISRLMGSKPCFA